MFTDSKNTQSVSTDKNLTKNEEALKAKIPAHLRIYEQLKEWSDLGQVHISSSLVASQTIADTPDLPGSSHSEEETPVQASRAVP